MITFVHMLTNLYYISASSIRHVLYIIYLCSLCNDLILYLDHQFDMHYILYIWVLEYIYYIYSTKKIYIIYHSHKNSAPHMGGHLHNHSMQASNNITMDDRYCCGSAIASCHCNIFDKYCVICYHRFPMKTIKLLKSVAFRFIFCT